MSPPRVLAVLVAVLVALLGAAGVAAPARAHPFGEPQSIVISASATGLRVEWRAAPDDITALAAHLGVVGGSHIVVFEDGEYDAEESSVSAGVRLGEAAPVLSDYLLDHLEVRTAGEECAGELQTPGDVTSTGAVVLFDCGGPVRTADITISTLTDLHPDYRTLAAGPRGQRHVYSRDRDTHRWQVPAGVEAHSAGRSAALQLGGTAIAVVLAGLGLRGLARRRRRASAAALHRS